MGKFILILKNDFTDEMGNNYMGMMGSGLYGPFANDNEVGEALKTVGNTRSDSFALVISGELVKLSPSKFLGDGKGGFVCKECGTPIVVAKVARAFPPQPGEVIMDGGPVSTYTAEVRYCPKCEEEPKGCSTDGLY